MHRPVITFFNNKGGVGKTSLIYHVSWMMAEQGYKVVAADLDPQANLSAAFLDEDRLETIWPETDQRKTIYGALQQLKRGVGDVADPYLEPIADNLWLLPGDVALSEFEDQLSENWPKCLDRDERAFRVISSFWRVLQRAAVIFAADCVLMDLGPSLGAINRAALIASDSVVIPLGPDIFSLQGLRNLGPTLRDWRTGWVERVDRNPARDLELPDGSMGPLGYIVMQHSVRRNRPVKSYQKWIGRIPPTYRECVLNEPTDEPLSVETDPHCLCLLKHYRSLMPMAQEARKPMFLLKPADGAMGAHTAAVRDAYEDFQRLSLDIAERAGLKSPAPY